MNSNKLNLGLNIFRYVLGALGILACILVIGGPNANNELEVVEGFREGGRMAFAINYTGFIVIACLALVLIFFVVQLISNPKKTIMSIIGIVAVFVLYFVLSMMGSSDAPEDLALQVSEPVSQGTVNSTTAGLWTAIITIVVTFLAAVLGPVIARFRK